MKKFAKRNREFFENPPGVIERFSAEDVYQLIAEAMKRARSSGDQNPNKTVVDVMGEERHAELPEVVQELLPTVLDDVLAYMEMFAAGENSGDQTLEAITDSLSSALTAAYNEGWARPSVRLTEIGSSGYYDPEVGVVMKLDALLEDPEMLRALQESGNQTTAIQALFPEYAEKHNLE
jgi:hypothetical protein